VEAAQLTFTQVTNSAVLIQAAVAIPTHYQQDKLLSLRTFQAVDVLPDDQPFVLSQAHDGTSWLGLRRFCGHCWSTVGPLLVHFWSTSGPLLVHCWSTVGPLLVHCWSIAGPLLVHCWSTAGPLLVHFWSTVGPLLVHCWSIAGPLPAGRELQFVATPRAEF
jgi:hypothetical protein